MSNKQEEFQVWMSAKAEDPEIPAWKSLDIVCRKWAVMSGFEKDQEKYAKLREISLRTRPKWQE
jgi:uncharacterized membrane-anchored protein